MELDAGTTKAENCIEQTDPQLSVLMGLKLGIKTENSTKQTGQLLKVLMDTKLGTKTESFIE